MTGTQQRRIAAIAVGWALIAAALLPAQGLAREDRIEVRKRVACPGPGYSDLRVRARDGELRVRFEVNDRRGGRTWKAVLVQERVVRARVTMRTSRQTGEAEFERRLSDFAGSEVVSVRLTGSGGRVCRVEVTVPSAS